MKKLTIENKFETYSVEFKNMDVSLEQFFDSLKGLLISCSWMEETIDEFIIEWAESIKNLKGWGKEDGFETYEKAKEEIHNRVIQGNSEAVDNMFEPTPTQQEFVGFNYLISKKDE